MAALSVIVMVVCALWFLVYLDREARKGPASVLVSKTRPAHQRRGNP